MGLDDRACALDPETPVSSPTSPMLSQVSIWVSFVNFLQLLNMEPYTMNNFGDC